jgi:hypothetical protein
MLDPLASQSAGGTGPAPSPRAAAAEVKQHRRERCGAGEPVEHLVCGDVVLENLLRFDGIVGTIMGYH